MSETLALHGGPKAVSIPYQEGWNQITDAEINAVLNLLRGNVLSIGDGSGIVGEFEQAFAEFCGTKYALAMNSGTATLHSAYFACGVGPGAEVIVPAYTWHATITPILHCAATPVFCEIDPSTLTADPADVEKRITPRTKAISVVHVWGIPAKMDALADIARRHGLRLIEDCSHAHGATYQGRPLGSWGDIGCFSMQGSKAVSGGESGVATTSDPELFDRMLLLGHFGRIASGEKADTFVHLGDMSLGTKYRPHPLAIAIANEHLKRLPELNRLRRRNFDLLRENLRGCPGVRPVEPYPESTPGAFLEFKYHYDPEALGGVSREKFAEAVRAEGAPLSVDRYSSFNYTYGLLHLAPLFNTFDRTQLGGCFYDFTVNDGKPMERYQPGSLPVTERICQQLIGLPGLTDVPEEFVLQCAQAIRKVAESAEELHEEA